MTAPNIVNVATITGKLVGYAVTDSLGDVGVSNSSSSGKVFKVNAMYAANVDGTNDAHVSVSVQKGGSTDFYIVKTVNVPADSTLDVLSKAIYLEENDKIRAVAQASSDIQLLVSYEEIS